MPLIGALFVVKVLFTGFFFLGGAYMYFRRFMYDYWRRRSVAYVEPTVPVGNLGRVVMGKLFVGELYAEAYAKYKKNRYFGVYNFHKPSLVITDPDLARLVLTKEFNHFHDRGLYCNEKIDPLSGHLFLLPGAKWRKLRVKLTPTFTSGKMKEMFVTVADEGTKLSNYLKPRAERREIVEVKDLFARFSTDVIMSAAFGVSSNCMENPDSEFRYWGQKAFEARPFWNTLSMFAPKIMEFFSMPFTDRGVSRFFIKAFNETFRYREANNVVRPDFMNLLMQLMRRGYLDRDNDEDVSTVADVPSAKVTAEEAVAQAFVFFLAGFETTSSTITYCLYELALHQDIQDKVMEDIDAALKKFGGLTYESLQEMTYLHKAVSETLRKYPPVAMLNRVCTNDIDLPTTNLRLSKGVDVVVPVLGIHRDPEIYPEPEKFDPSRFDADKIASRHPYTYLPFGEGPRVCIGTRFGYAQTKVGLISMLAKYRVRLSPDTPVPLKCDEGTLMLTPKGGINLIVEPR